jgi:hypothetical protein
MARLLRYLLILIVLAAAAGAVYALLVDLPPPTRPVEIDVAPQSQ